MSSILRFSRAFDKSAPDWSLYCTVADDLGRLPSDDEIDLWLYIRENGVFPDDHERATVDYTEDFGPEPDDALWWSFQHADDLD